MSGMSVASVEESTSLRRVLVVDETRRVRAPKRPHPLVVELVSARKRRSLSKAEIARRCGWSRQFQGKLEKTHNPSVASLSVFAKAMDLRMAFIEDPSAG